MKFENESRNFECLYLLENIKATIWLYFAIFSSENTGRIYEGLGQMAN